VASRCAEPSWPRTQIHDGPGGCLRAGTAHSTLKLLGT
jgi:hypothetical protein